MDDCQFNIKLKDGPVEWITQFFDMEHDENIKNSGCSPYPYNPTEEGTCYCQIPLSNNFVQVWDYIKQAHDFLFLFLLDESQV